MKVLDFDGRMIDVAPTVLAICGNVAEFDDGAGHGYRCTRCGAVLGSVGMPGECSDLYKKQKVWKALGGKVENEYEV